VRIDSRLNLVIPIERSDGAKIYVHSTPISREVFETHFEPLAATFSRLMSLGYLVGARVAALMIEKVAKQIGEWDTPGGIQTAFWPEVHRLTLVLTPSEKGYEPIPFDTAVHQKQLDAEDVAEIDNALAFFTLASRMLRRNMISEVDGAVRTWGASTTSSNSTEFARSLQTSIKPENSGGTVAA
jgi:hypothetical protein